MVISDEEILQLIRNNYPGFENYNFRNEPISDEGKFVVVKDIHEINEDFLDVSKDIFIRGLQINRQTNSINIVNICDSVNAEITGLDEEIYKALEEYNKIYTKAFLRNGSRWVDLKAFNLCCEKALEIVGNRNPRTMFNISKYTYLLNNNLLNTANIRLSLVNLRSCLELMHLEIRKMNYDMIMRPVTTITTKTGNETIIKSKYEFFDSIVGGKDGILYETAGALGNGERIFITAKLPDYIRVGKDDLIEQFLFLTTSHDGYGSISAAFTPVRIVCANTLNAAMRNHSNSIKIRHTANAKDRLKQAHKLLGLTNQLASELEEVFNHWSRVRITDNEVKRLVQIALAPNKEVVQCLQDNKQDVLSTTYNNIVSSVMEYALTSPTQQEVTTRGTLFGAYNAVTGYFQNVRNYKDDEAKLKSIMYGTGLSRTQTAFDLCTSFAKKGNNALSLN